MSNESGVRIYYLRDPQTIRPAQDDDPGSRGTPVGCLASHYDPKTRMLRFGLATGAPNQSFEKRLFRAMAEVRLKHKSLSLTFEEAEPNGHEINKRIMSALATSSEECLRQKRAAKTPNTNKHKKSAVNSFASFLRAKVSQGKNLIEVLDEIETKSNSDWRKSISLRAGEAAKAWLAMASVPKTEAIPAPPDTQRNFTPTFKESPVSITAIIQSKVESFVASSKR